MAQSRATVSGPAVRIERIRTLHNSAQPTLNVDHDVERCSPILGKHCPFFDSERVWRFLPIVGEDLRLKSLCQTVERAAATHNQFPVIRVHHPSYLAPKPTLTVGGEDNASRREISRR